MRFLKLLVVLLLVGGLLYGGYYYLSHWNNCHLPVKFGVGKVDNRFKISESETSQIAQEAANRWNQQTGDNLLQYDPEAKLKINLVYDNRQADLDKMNAQVNSLNKDKTSVDNWKEEYEKALTNYQKDLTAYNNEVSAWNSKGGAPSDVYQSLQSQKADLEKRRQDLNNLAKTLNLKIDQYNNSLSNLNQQIQQRKNLIVTQGEYIPSENTINVYTFGNNDELRLVLMHELGHAIGLGHENTNTLSIMNPMLGDQDLKNPVITQQDKTMLLESCNVKGSKFRLQWLLKLFRSQISSY